VESLTSNNLLKDKRLYKAFLEIPLEEFIPQNYQDPLKIYQDIPNLFYYHDPNNYRTISAPHMITIMLQGLALERDDDLLILGAKSGYIAALAHELAPQGEIIILEANSEIANLTEENLKKLDLDHNITVIVKNPLEGMPDLTPWQKILVTGAIKQTRITPLLRQLDKNEGVIYAPIGEGLVQTYTQILRVDNNFYGKKQLQVRFTPLMTQVELDELELITDLEEYEEVEVEINPKKVDKTLEKINIKYETNVFDEISFGEKGEEKPVGIKERDEAIEFLKDLDECANKFKREDDVNSCFENVEEMDAVIESLKTFKKDMGLKVKKIQNILNQIRSYNIVRKQFESRSIDDAEIIDKKAEIINKQIAQVNELEDIINAEIERLKKMD
jgi:protein-L-isoaspartate(D-aspartate) O-methyltransferase